MTASALATAGGLVFGGTADRQFFALNSDTGELLWQTRLNGDVSGAPVSYELGGKQYIAVASGGRAAPTTTLGRLVGVDVPQGSGVMWVFALPDDEPRPVPRPTRRDRPTRSLGDGVFTANQAAQGKQLFAQECSLCHQSANYTGANFAAKWGEGTLGDVYSGHGARDAARERGRPHAGDVREHRRVLRERERLSDRQRRATRRRGAAARHRDRRTRRRHAVAAARA